MGAELHETMMGQKFYNHDIPQIVKALNRIADALDKIAEKEEEAKENDGWGGRDTDPISGSALKWNI